MRRPIVPLLTLFLLLSSCSEPEQTSILIKGQTILVRPTGGPVDETGIIVRAVGTSVATTTDRLGLYDAGPIVDQKLLIEHHKEGYGRKLFLAQDYSAGPINLVKLFPLTPHIAITGEPRYFDTTFTQLERVGVKVNNQGDTTDWGTVIDKSYTTELLTVPVIVDASGADAQTQFWTVDLYYSLQPEVDIMKPRTYLWMQTEHLENSQAPGSSVHFYLDQQLLNWMKRDLVPEGSKIFVQAFASPYQRPLNGVHAWHSPFFTDPDTRLPVLSIYEGVTSNSSSFILK
jgi:hypothetical protein